VEIKGLIEASLIDWPGRLATVVFLPGCNFRCGYCHARALLSAGSVESIPLDKTLDYVRDMEGWIDGVVISGGEPTLDRGLPALAAELKSRGVAVKLDTNGTRPDVIERLAAEGLIDAVSMDVKAPLDYRYFEIAGTVFDLSSIRRSIEFLKASDLEVEFRTTVAPFLLSPIDIGAIAGELEGARRYVLQPFRPHSCLDARLEKMPPCPRQYLEDAARIARGFVREVVIRGA
jgi:pyruvate formate lyase activating enzyme